MAANNFLVLSRWEFLCTCLPDLPISLRSVFGYVQITDAWRRGATMPDVRKGSRAERNKQPCEGVRK